MSPASTHRHPLRWRWVRRRSSPRGVGLSVRPKAVDNPITPGDGGFLCVFQQFRLFSGARLVKKNIADYFDLCLLIRVVIDAARDVAVGVSALGPRAEIGARLHLQVARAKARSTPIFARVAGDEGPGPTRPHPPPHRAPRYPPGSRPSRAQRRLDVRRRHARSAAAVAAPARDGGGRPRTRGSAATPGDGCSAPALPRRDHVRHDRGRRSGHRGRPRGARRVTRHRARRSGLRGVGPAPDPLGPRRRDRQLPACARPLRCAPLDAAGRDAYVAETAHVARALGAVDVPETVAELDEVLADYRPELRARPRRAGGCAVHPVHPPVPLPSAPYALLSAAAVATDAALDAGRCGCRTSRSPRPPPCGPAARR